MNRSASRASRRVSAGSLAALAALLLAVNGCGSSATDSRPARPAPAASTASGAAGDLTAHPVVQRVDPRLRARFALLRTPPEPLPARTRRIMGPPTLGVNWRLAQRIPVALAGAYWLVPGDGHLCVVSQGDAGTPGVGSVCARNAQALRHGIADVTIARATPATGGRPARLIVGVAPDGARAVRVHTHGAVSEAAVVDALFVVRDAVDRPPDGIELR